MNILNFYHQKRYRLLQLEPNIYYFLRIHLEKLLLLLSKYVSTRLKLIQHKYTREEAAFPNEHVKHNKYWAPVARVDNVYGDRNLVCSCPSMDEYKDEAA